MSPMHDPRPTVFIVIPVFNRLALTKECLDSLRCQTYAPLCLIVVDGGSTDGTLESLPRHYPEVVLLQGEGELWWGGAMQLGIEFCLQRSRHQDDMLLMMNNDTLVDPDYVATLVRVSREHHAAVGGVIVDSANPSRVLDAGEYIDWTTYSFPVKTVCEPGDTYVDGVDLLSGRGTLVPLSMVREAGNVNGARFPHYIADCEFFSRLKRKGFGLGVTWEAMIRSHVGMTGLSTQHSEPLSFRQAWKALFSKRSMDNVPNHWRFIEDCAPASLRRPLQRRLIRRCVSLVASRTALRHIVLPLAWGLTGVYYVRKADCVACGCDAEILCKAGLLKPWRRDDWYLLDKGFRVQSRGDQRLRLLYRRAWNPLTKIMRWIRSKQQCAASDDAPSHERLPVPPASSSRLEPAPASPRAGL
jgi:GT2 family glycosyltransferase